jgi:hypothetical protein
MTLQRRIGTMQSFLRQRQDVLRFDDVPDPRQARGQRWSADALMSTAILSLVLMVKSLRGAERLSEDLVGAQRKRGIDRRVPDSTLGDFLAAVDPAPVRRHLHRQVLSEHRRKALEPEVVPMRVASIDGKTVATVDGEMNPDCQKHNPEGQIPHWLYRVVRATLISSAAAMCIDQKAIPATTNDMGVFGDFFDELERTYRRADLFETVFTDAGFTSEANARKVDAAGKGYIMNLKANQPDLLADAQQILLPQARKTDPEAETDWECDSTRGWIKRQLWRTDQLAGGRSWSHLRQVWLVRVLVRLHGKNGPERVLEDRFYVTNLVSARLKPRAILDLVRAHWRIENNCFGRLDVEWQEDHGRWVRRGNGLPVVSLLRVIAYNLVEILRTTHLRSVGARKATWQQLRDWLRDALVWPRFAGEDDPPLDPEAIPI